MFIGNKQILDGILIADETFDSRKRSRTVLFKVDLEKAYNHVEWGSVDYTFSIFGF